MSQSPKLLAVLLAIVAIGCGQMVTPDASQLDTMMPDSGSSEDRISADSTDEDSSMFPDDRSNSDAVSDAAEAHVDAVDASDSSRGWGFEPVASVVVSGRTCHDLPFTDMLPVLDQPGAYPYPLRGGDVRDGVYRSVRVERFLDGVPLGPGRLQFYAYVLRIRGTIWEVSRSGSPREPFDRRTGVFSRVRFIVRRETPFSFERFVDCPLSEPFSSLMDSYETDGTMFRIGAGDEVYTFERVP